MHIIVLYALCKTSSIILNIFEASNNLKILIFFNLDGIYIINNQGNYEKSNKTHMK